MARQSTSSAKPGQLGTAVVVEDDVLLAFALEQTLRDGGAQDVVICASIAEAMAALETHRPEILVLDVQLADHGNGWAIAELAVELSPDPPTIVFSTGQPDRIPAKVAQLGVVLEKPYSPEMLLEVLTRQARKPGLFGRLRQTLTE